MITWEPIIARLLWCHRATASKSSKHTVSLLYITRHYWCYPVTVSIYLLIFSFHWSIVNELDLLGIGMYWNCPSFQGPHRSALCLWLAVTCINKVILSVSINTVVLCSMAKPHILLLWITMVLRCSLWLCSLYSWNTLKPLYVLVPY